MNELLREPPGTGLDHLRRYWKMPCTNSGKRTGTRCCSVSFRTRALRKWDGVGSGRERRADAGGTRAGKNCGRFSATRHRGLDRARICDFGERSSNRARWSGGDAHEYIACGGGNGNNTHLLKLMTLTQLKLGISALVVAGATTALVVQHQAQIKLHEKNESLTQQITQLKVDNENLSNRFATAGGSKSLSDESIE